MNVTELIARTSAEARPYQKRIVDKAFYYFTQKSMRSILIESPTGSGKTIMALLIAKAMHDELGVRIGWVAMRRHLLTQAQDENVSKGINVPLTFMSMFDKNPPANLDALIVDEAQHDVTGSMAHIHAIVEPKYILGMTATPFRHDRVKLCFDSVIKDAGIPTLIKDGYLSPYHHYTIPEWGVEQVVTYYITEPERWGKSIMYFHRLEQCFEAAKRLQEAGISCDVVHGSSNTAQQIDDFDAGKIRVLLNCMKLTEGFDCPDLKTVFCRPSCKSVTIQMAGRVLRKHRDHPYKQIVQCAKTTYPFQRTALAVIQHIRVNEEWRTLEVNKDIDNINRRTVRALANIETEMPKFITASTKSGRRFGVREARRTGSESLPNITPTSHVVRNVEGLPDQIESSI